MECQGLAAKQTQQSAWFSTAYKKVKLFSLLFLDRLSFNDLKASTDAPTQDVAMSVGRLDFLQIRYVIRQTSNELWQRLPAARQK